MEKQLSIYSQVSKEKKGSALPEKREPKHTTWTVYVDGAARGNPGPAGAGIWVVSGDEAIIKKGIYLGHKTNNQAEYLALALALYFVHTYCKEHDLPLPALHIISDSELLIKQCKGIYKVKNDALKLLKGFIDSMLIGIRHSFSHVLRENNKNADSMANTGVDKKIKMPIGFSKIMAEYFPLITDIL
jgi:ribonuclease HI